MRKTVKLSNEDYKKARTIIRKDVQSLCSTDAYNVCSRIVSKREQKRRLYKLQHMSKEELMQAYYLQQEKQAFTIGTQIERNAFEIGKGVRIRKRAKNTFSKEEFGTCGNTISVRKFAVSQEFTEKRGTSVRKYTLTSYTNVVCKSRNLY